MVVNEEASVLRLAAIIQAPITGETRPDIGVRDEYAAQRFTSENLLKGAAILPMF